MGKSKGTLISLGAGENQIPFLKIAQDENYEIIGIDKNPSAPGFQYCKTKIIESVTEYRKIYSKLVGLSPAEPISGIGCRSYGKAILSASYLCEKFSLPGSPLATLVKFYDKAKVKNELKENGIPVPEQYPLETLNIKKNKQHIPFPLIYKPVDGASKKDIKILNKVEDIKRLKPHPGNFFLEEYIDGQEFTVLGLVSRGNLYPISISDKYTTQFPPFLEIAHCLPSRYPNLEGEILLLLRRIINLLNYSTGPIVAEFKANKKGELYLMEVMPEVGGEFIAEELIPKHYKYNYFKQYLKLITGGIPEPRLKKKDEKKNTLIHFMVPPMGKFVFKRIDERDENEKPNYFFKKELIKEEEVVDTESGNRSRVWVFGYEKSSVSELEFKPKVVGNLEAVFEKHE